MINTKKTFLQHRRNKPVECKYNPEYVDELNIKIYTTFVASKEIVWFIFLTLKVKQTWKWAIKEEYLSCS